MSLKNLLCTVYSVMTISVGMICASLLLVFFVRNPDLYRTTKTVVTSIIQGGLLLSICKYLWKEVRSRARTNRNLSKAIFELICAEPILQLLIWLFVLVGVYLLPIHFVAVKLRTNIEQDKVAAAKMSPSIRLKTSDEEYDLTHSFEEGGIYRSRRLLAWRDPAQIIVEGFGLRSTSTDVPWSAFIFVDIIRGVNIDLTLLPKQKEQIKLEIIVDPQVADISVECPPGSLFFSGKSAGLLSVPKDQLLKITVSADEYYTNDTTLVAEESSQLKIKLEEKDGEILLIGRNPAGHRIAMDIYIDDSLIPQKAGEWVHLQAGDYRIKLVYSLGASERYIVSEFLLRLNRGERRQMVLDAELERL